MLGLERIALWDNIPQELKDNCRWAMATLAPLTTERPYKVDKSPRNPFTGNHLSPNNDKGWVTFEEVISRSPNAIGVRLTRDDPYVVIDIDKRETYEQEAVAAKILKALSPLDTYVERSVGHSVNRALHEQGYNLTEQELNMMTYHIIIKGEPSAAMVRKPIELYSQDRFIILTGDVVSGFEYSLDSDNKVYAIGSALIGGKPKPIQEGGEYLIQLKTRLSVDLASQYSQIELKTHAQRERDETVIRRMFSGNLGDIYKSLYQEIPNDNSTWAKWAREDAAKGNRPLPDISHSGHEMALANRITQQTQNPEQFLRIFKASQVYRGSKSGYPTVESYEQKYLIHYTFKAALQSYYSKQQEERAFEDALAAHIKQSKTLYDDYLSQKDKLPSVKEPLPPIERPEGLLGDIAQYIYDSSPRPLWEAAITGALALLAALAGRENNINGSGLTQYLIITAKSGRGKESAQKGANYLLDRIIDDIPAARIFKGASHTASGPAIHGMLARGLVGDDSTELVLPSKLLTYGEVSTTFSSLTEKDPSEYAKTLKKVLLDAWGKSGHKSKMDQMVYADSKRIVPAVRAPNLCILSDTTPESLAEVITVSSIRDGFFPRWTLVEYRGPRPKPNKNAHLVEPDKDMLARLKAITISSLKKNQENICTSIAIDDEAMAIYEAFEEEADMTMQDLEDSEDGIEIEHIWNRAGLKVLRVAGIIAVGKNHIEPIVMKQDMEWAIALIRRDMKSFTDRIVAEHMFFRHEERVSELHGYVLHWFNEMDTSQKLSAGAEQWQIDRGVMPQSILVHAMYSVASFVDPGKWESNRTFDQFIEMTIRAAWTRGLIRLHRLQDFEGINPQIIHGGTVSNSLISLGDAKSTFDFKSRRIN